MTASRAASRVLVLAVCCASPVAAQTLPDLAVAQIDRVFAPFTAPGSPGCVVGIGRDGREVFAKGYGLANLEYDVPLTAQSISESGSVAKQFTAAALALLQLDGKLSLDDDIRRYLPEVPDFGQTITIRHLLTHTSGLRDQWALLSLLGRGPGRQVHTMPIILDLVTRQQELNFPVGSEYLYSNTGYALAAMIVTRVSGMPFAQFSTERLFKPLGMTQTAWRDDYRRVVPGRATAYSRDGTGWVQDMPFTMVHGNGGLLTTVGDLLKWNTSLDAGLLGKPELTRMLETTGTLTGGQRIEYALGLSVSPYREGVREVSHGGSTAGYRTWLARFPEARTSIAIFCNAGTANPTALGRRVLAVVLPADAPPRSAPTPIAADERARIIGPYRDPRTDDWLSIAVAGDYARVVGPSADSLRRESDGTYSTAGGFRLTFEPRGAKATTLRLVSSDGVTRTMVAAPTPAGSGSLAEYAGRYQSPELGAVIVVRAENGALRARISPDDDSALIPFYEDGFRVAGSGITLRFVREAGAKIGGVRVFAGRARNVRFDRLP